MKKVWIGLLIIVLLYRKITAVGRITICLWVGTLLTVGTVVLTGPFHFSSKLAFDFPPQAFHFSLGFLFGLGAAARIFCIDLFAIERRGTVLRDEVEQTPDPDVRRG